MSGAGRDDKDQLWSEATLWFARMRSPDAEAFRPEFEEWLARGALHRRYYNRASEHWMHSTAAYSEEPSRAHSTTNVPAPPRQAGRGRGAIAAAIAGSVLIASSTILFVAHRGEESRAGPSAAEAHPPSTTQYTTAEGEQRGVQLADGSVVILDSETVLRVKLGAAIRRLELDRGKARFDVAHEARPFVVFAGGGSITAHGTVFDVRVTPDHRVSVRLVRGSVDVRFPAAARPHVEPLPRRLHPGETVSFDAAAKQAADQPNASPARAQAEAARDYRDVRLADLVSEANRHAAVPIRFADPAIGAQTVSGRFRTDDTALLAERLAALFNLVVDHSSGAEILLRSK